MVFSALLLLILAVNGFLAVDSNRVANDGNTSEGAVHARGLRSNQKADSLRIKGAKGSDADSGLSLRGLSETDDVDSYVNDNLPDNGQLLYVVYDYDDGANDKNVHVIDPESLAASPVRDASEALMRKINETTFNSF